MAVIGKAVCCSKNLQRESGSPAKCVRDIFKCLPGILKYVPVMLLSLPMALKAQTDGPVKFSVTAERISKDEIKVKFYGKIDAGWHVYSSGNLGNETMSASFNVDESKNVEPAGGLVPGEGVVTRYDEVFGAELSFFEGVCSFTQALKITGKDYHIKCYLEYGACNNKNCLPPAEVPFEMKGTDGPDTAAQNTAAQNAAAAPAVKRGGAAVYDTIQAASDSAAGGSGAAAVMSDAAGGEAGWWEPQAGRLAMSDSDSGDAERPLPAVFLLGMLGGLVALLTPCVWPVIPMTVGFFLHRGGGRRKSVRDALAYGLAIIVIFLVLALAVTAAFGVNKMNELSTNAVFNVFFFLLLLLFAASFIGGFNLNLPSSWTNAIDRKSESASGFLSIFLMAFTLVLVSFSCTCPIVGLLLVEVASTGDILAPAAGLLGFASALALPFALFAMFPMWLKQMPKSGSWMNVVKVTLGFVELAFALKFLSVADLAYGWHILDRETFLALWIAIAITLALYFFGVISIHGEKTDVVAAPRVFLGVISLAFAVYMIPGLWGAPLRAVSAFAPPMTTQDFRLGDYETRPAYTDYESGMRAARRLGKPVLLDFTGYGCVNCRKMEASVWTDPGISRMLKEDYVLISLYVDDKQRLPGPLEVNVRGKKRTLRTVGDKWSFLQQVKFGANAQPFYVALDNDGRPLTGAYAFDESVSDYRKFLKRGLDNYRKQKTARAGRRQARSG